MLTITSSTWQNTSCHAGLIQAFEAEMEMHVQTQEKPRMVFVGPQGSGKTVYMAMFYDERRLLVRGKVEYTWSLDIAPNRVQEMTGYIQHIKNPQEELITAGTEELITKATSEVKEWEFAAIVNQHSALDFTYVDFPGEILTEAQQQGSALNEQFARYLATASIVYGIFDGDDVLNLVRGKKQKKDFESKYEYIINQLLYYKGPNPVHFLITKWDAFEDQHIDLGQVRRKLLEVQSVVDFANTRKKLNKNLSSETRLIPVSSLEGLAQHIPASIQGKRGQDIRKPGGEVHPQNVDIPLAFALIDLIEARKKELNEGTITKQRTALFAMVQRISSVDVKTIGNIASNAVGKLVPFLITALAAFLGLVATIIATIVGFIVQTPDLFYTAIAVSALFALVVLFISARIVRNVRRNREINRIPKTGTTDPIKLLTFLSGELAKQVKKFEQKYGENILVK